MTSKLPQNLRREFVSPSPFFWQLVAAHYKQPQENVFAHYTDVNLVALDPGETTGVCIWLGEKGKFELFQLETKNIGQSYDMLEEVLEEAQPIHVRYEEYRVYNWVSHDWQILHTPQLIGAIIVLCHLNGYEHSRKLAQHAKAQWTDDNLKRANLYEPGLKHARDALRHCCFYMSNPTLQD